MRPSAQTQTHTITNTQPDEPHTLSNQNPYTYALTLGQTEIGKFGWG